MLPEPIKKHFLLIFFITYSIFLFFELDLFADNAIEKNLKAAPITEKTITKTLPEPAPVNTEVVNEPEASEITAEPEMTETINAAAPLEISHQQNITAEKPQPQTKKQDEEAKVAPSKDLLATAYSYTKIGNEFYDEGEYDKALEFYFKALLSSKKASGSENSKVAELNNSIGLAYYGQNDLNKALQYYKKSLEIKEKIFGKNHPSLGASYNNIGIIYQKKQEYSKAVEYFSKDLLICEKGLGTDHPLTKEVRENIEHLKILAGGG